MLVDRSISKSGKEAMCACARTWAVLGFTLSCMRMQPLTPEPQGAGLGARLFPEPSLPAVLPRLGAFLSAAKPQPENTLRLPSGCLM